MNINELKSRNNDIYDRISSIEETAEKENRELTQKEAAESHNLKREFERNYMAIRNHVSQNQSVSADSAKAQRERNLNAQLREIIKNQQNREITSSIISSGDKNNMVSAGAIPTTIFDVLPVLEKGLIWDKLGMKVMTGARSLVWPYATSAVEVTEKGETAQINDTDINFDNITATPYAAGISIRVTNEALDDSDFDLLGFVITQMGLAVRRWLNKKTFSPANWSGLAGPFKNATAVSLNLTYANIKAKKALIAATGVDMTGFAYVCDSKTLALLETTPKANGQGGFICERGMIDGDPVFVTEYINAKADGSYETTKYYLEMGCFNYLAANQHGETRLTVDALSRADYGETKVTLFTRWSLTNIATATAFAIYDLVGVYDGTVAVSGSVNVGNTTANPVPTQEVTEG